MRQDNMKVYQKALELVANTHQQFHKLPPGYAFLSDQMRRASASASASASNTASACASADFTLIRNQLYLYYHSILSCLKN